MRITVFIKNTVILVATSLILRTTGILFRIYLADKIGSEGMGLYQLIFSVYILSATFASSGISTAVTRLVADNLDNGRRAVRRIMRAAAAVTLGVAAVSVAVIFFGAEPIAVYLLKDERATVSLRILSFSLPFMGLSSCARGYFIACRKTVQPSVVQMIEQAVRIGVVLTALTLNATKSIEYCAAAVLLGDTVAETASFVINWALYIRDVKGIKAGGAVKNIYSKILKIALPISGGSYISTALHTTENLLIPTRLSRFHGSRERGLELFGAIRGMALPILFFPASFLTSLSTMLIPEVSQARSAGNSLLVKQTVEKAFRITLVLSVFAAAVFFFNAEEIGNILYGDRDVGQMIRVLSPIVPFMYLESVAAGMLKGLDCQMSMFKYNAADSVLRIAAVFLLLPKFGMKGYLVIMIISNCFTSSLNCRRLLKASGVKPDIIGWIVKPAVMSVAGGAAALFITRGIAGELPRAAAAVLIQSAVFLPASGIIKPKKQRSR